MDSFELSSSLYTLTVILHKEIRKQIQSVSDYSMTELETLGLLAHHESLLASELATLTRVTTQSMSQILKKLEDHQMIERSPCEKDKRKTYISLTQSGAEAIHKIKREKTEWLKNAIEQRLSTTEQKQLEDILPVLQRLLNLF